MLAAMIAKVTHLLLDKLFENSTQAWRKR
jgi:hypothetical protein